MSRRVRLAAVFVAALLAACPRNPATGKRQLQLVSEEQEIALGEEGAAQVRQTIGLYPDPALQAYVAGVGSKLAAKSERPDLPWSFGVVDDASVNAFALPGGKIFITRGLLAYLGSEAELAAVLGHEIGHVTARHSVTQLSRQSAAQLGLGLGSVLVPELQTIGQVAGAGLQLLFLKYGRNDEDQADALGIEYLQKTGYQPGAMPELLNTLADVSALSDQGGRLPQWLSTHPEPEARVAKTKELLAESGIAPARGTQNRDSYLRRIDGLVFGEDPRQGYFHESTFIAPNLKFQMNVPQGWQAQNTPTAMVAVDPNKKAAVQLSVAPSVPPAEALQQFSAQRGVRIGKPVSVDIQGAPAAASLFAAQSQSGNVEGVVAFVRRGDLTLQYVGYTVAGGLGSYEDLFVRTVNSLGPIKDPALASVRPLRVQVVRLDEALTLKEFEEARPSKIPLERLAVLNDAEPGATLRAGLLVKRVS